MTFSFVRDAEVMVSTFVDFVAVTATPSANLKSAKAVILEKSSNVKVSEVETSESKTT